MQVLEVWMKNQLGGEGAVFIVNLPLNKTVAA
jgi:hypothetical protein